MDFEIMEKDEIPGGEYVFAVAKRKEKACMAAFLGRDR